jgi:hypothetical protein
MDLVRAATAGVADPDGALSRMLPILDADPSIVADTEMLRRVAAITGASRP